MFTPRIIFADPLGMAADLAPVLLRNLNIGFLELAKSFEFGATVWLSIDRSIPTADTEIVSGGLKMRVNDLYYRDVTDLNPTWRVGDPIQPGKDAPDYLGQHEGLHAFFSLANPAFLNLTVLGREGGGFQRYFFGQNAQAVYGGPVPIDEHGHVLGDTLGDIMSGQWPTFRDRPQVLSAIDLAILTDVGVTIFVPSDGSPLADLYAVTFGRAPDAAGLSYWQQRMAAGMPLTEIAQNFLAQPEAQAIFAGGHLVEKVYLHAFGRVPDPAGFAYWTDALESGRMREGEFVLAVLKGAQGDDLHKVDLIGQLLEGM